MCTPNFQLGLVHSKLIAVFSGLYEQQVRLFYESGIVEMFVAFAENRDTFDGQTHQYTYIYVRTQ